MMRTIERDQDKKGPMLDIARREDVDTLRLREKYLKKLDDEDEPMEDDRPANEIQNEHDAESVGDTLMFFGMEEELEEGAFKSAEDPYIGITDEEIVREVSGKAETQTEQNAKSDKADGDLEVVMEFTKDDEDPHLASEYKEKSERIVQKLQVGGDNPKDSPEGTVFESAREESRNYDRQSARSGYASSYGRETGSTFRSAEPNRTTTSSTETVYDDKAKQEQAAFQLSHASERVKDFVHNGPKKQKKKKRVNLNQFGRRKFTWKGMWQSAKEWLSSDEAALLFKFGMMLCMETTLAVMTHKFQFEGTKQVMAFLAMMTGVFYIGRELNADGYDSRRLSFI